MNHQLANVVQHARSEGKIGIELNIFSYRARNQRDFKSIRPVIFNIEGFKFRKGG